MARQAPALNEGRSLNPGDTCGSFRVEYSMDSAQRRPESEPRRHRPRRPSGRVRAPALNEGRSLNPGDTLRSPSPSARRGALNEGRSLNPGDTPRCRAGVDGTVRAQRRPESEPRRHRSLRRTSTSAKRPLNEGRSLNPGDTPNRSDPEFARAILPRFAHQSAELEGRLPHRGARSRDGETILPVNRAVFHPIRPIDRESQEVRSLPHRTHGFPRACSWRRPRRSVAPSIPPGKR